MSRFLFTAPPFTGHLLPAISISIALALRGNEVIWYGPKQARPLLPPEITFEEYDDAGKPEAGIENAEHRGWPGVKSLVEKIVVPMTKAVVPAMLAVIDRHRPDVLVVDQQMVAGALCARLRELPWATLCITSTTVLPYRGMFPHRPKILADIGLVLERELGLPLNGAFDSPYLLVLYTTKGFLGPAIDFPQHYEFVGPVFSHRRDVPEFPWEWLTRRPRIFISLGTVRGDRESNAKFFKVAIEALRDFEGQVVISAEPDLIDNPPEHILVKQYVPQVQLLKQMDMVVTHGGQNTVCEALAHGLPMVVAPMRHDQPQVANLVEQCGAGVRVRYNIITPSALRSAVTKVLSEPSYRKAAGRIKEEFLTAGGEVAAATALEALVAHRTVVRQARSSQSGR